MTPEGWERTTLGKNAKVEPGFAFSSDAFMDDVAESAPIVRMSDLKEGRLDLAGAKRVPLEMLTDLTRYQLHAGDFVFGMSGSLRNYAWVSADDEPCYLNQRVGKLVSLDSDRKFVAYLYLSVEIQQQLMACAAGAAQLNVSAAQIETLRVLLPPPPEQRKIAAILSSVDVCIEKTEAMISKLQGLKKALMQELLTKGLPPETAAKHGIKKSGKFNDSPLGKIPEEWEVVRLGEVCNKIQDGTHFSPQSKDGPYRYVTSRNIREGYIDLSNCGYITKEEHDAIFRRCPVTCGDLLFTKDGVNVGNAAINNLRDPFSLLSSVAVLDAKRNKATNTFLLYYLMSDRGRKVITDAISGLAITRLTLTAIKSLLCNLPNMKEQNAISDILTQTDSVMNVQTIRLTRLQSLKKALMQDLLTGKVRVKVD